MTHGELQNYFDENPLTPKGWRAHALIFEAGDKEVKKVQAPQSPACSNPRDLEALLLKKYRKGAERLGDLVVPFEVVHDLRAQVKQKVLGGLLRDRLTPIYFPNAVVQERIPEDQTLKAVLLENLSDGDLESATLLLDEVVKLDHTLIARGFFPAGSAPETYVTDEKGGLRIRDLSALIVNADHVRDCLASSRNADLLRNKTYDSYHDIFRQKMPERKVVAALTSFRAQVHDIYDPRMLNAFGKERRSKARGLYQSKFLVV